MKRALGWLIFIALLAAGYFLARDYIRRHPQDVPWTRLDLDDSTGMFTGRKLAALGDEPERCRALLRDARVADAAVPPRNAGPHCGYDNGMRLASRGRTLSYAPQPLVVSCPVAAALVLYERRVVQPAAQRHFGQRVTRIDHAGSYSCRRLYGRAEGGFSEHATADALDIFGFRLADGTSVSVLRDWRTQGPKAAFLREVREGSCDYFSTVLSPDYNAAHADHLHLDQAERGAAGWRLCR